MKNNKGYNDPTASIAIGRVAREEKRKQRALQRSTGEPFEPKNEGRRQTIDEIVKEYKMKGRYKK